jgi:hypothetical protein
MSTRQGGEEGSLFGFNLGHALGDDEQRVEANRRRFFLQLGLDPENVAFQQQIHETNITSVHEGGLLPSSDALVTRTPMLGLTVSAADCVPILLYAPGENTVAAIHAGWRGTMQKIAAKTLLHLREHHAIDPESTYAFIAPAAGPCCYEVGEEVAKHFPEDCIDRTASGAFHLDLKRANRLQLLDAGIPGENIEESGHCTICKPSIFHSHRRDGQYAGRMLAVIAMKEQI